MSYFCYKKPSFNFLNKENKQLGLYLLSNCISIGVGKFLPVQMLPYWIMICVLLGYQVNKRIFKK